MKKIVVIDDDDIFLFLCNKAIENLGQTETMVKFTNSQEGLEYLISKTDETNYPSMLMIDINMPLMDGWEIVEELEKRSPKKAAECKTFILSSSIDAKDKQRALSYKSVTGFVIKPLSEATLIEIARSTLASPFSSWPFSVCAHLAASLAASVLLNPVRHAKLVIFISSQVSCTN